MANESEWLKQWREAVEAAVPALQRMVDAFKAAGIPLSTPVTDPIVMGQETYGPSYVKPYTIASGAGPGNLAEVIGEAIGAASVCWTDYHDAGVFEDQRAASILDAVTEWINENYVSRDRHETILDEQRTLFRATRPIKDNPQA